mgnify:CR=1 FL=1
MQTVTLGCTGITVNKNGFGALPIQRVSADYAGMLLRKAYNAGITYFDTARSYSDSEEKMGLALSDVRENIIIATKTPSTTVGGFWQDLETSLRLLKTDYIDVYQFHNPAFCPKPGDGTGLYEAMEEAKKQGKIRFIGITNHRLGVAEEAAASGLYDTLQFPFCYLATERDIALVNLCKENHVGFISMKGLSGGLLNNAEACYAFMQEHPDVVPIWGIQHEWELDQWLELTERNPRMTPELQAVIDHDRTELSGDFCRSCGYCLPCAAGIDIPQAARMAQLLRRAPYKPYLSDEWREKMHQIKNCIHCNACKSRCPYGLDTPALLQKQLADYDAFYAAHHND